MRLTSQLPGLRDREGQLKGADFLHFYVLGNIARMHDGSMLYDAPRQAALAQQAINQEPGESYLPVYGPQFSLIFRPLAGLPYGWAAAAWMLASALTCAICCWLCCECALTCGTTARRFSSWLQPFRASSSWWRAGRTGTGLIAFTSVLFCFRAERLFLAGMALGLLAYKPQFGVMAAVVFVLTLEWRVIAGALMTGAGQLAVGALYYGRAALDTYFKGATQINQNASALEAHRQDA